MNFTTENFGLLFNSENEQFKKKEESQGNKRNEIGFFLAFYYMLFYFFSFLGLKKLKDELYIIFLTYIIKNKTHLLY